MRIEEDITYNGKMYMFEVQVGDDYCVRNYIELTPDGRILWSMYENADFIEVNNYHTQWTKGKGHVQIWDDEAGAVRGLTI